jgi:hypothetical protein
LAGYSYGVVGVGTSYQNLLLLGEPETLRLTLPGLGVAGWLVPVGPARTALLPQEGDGDYADVRQLARLLSGDAGIVALSNDVVDSDAVIMAAYRDGSLVHEYVSDQAMLVDWFIDDEGNSRFRLVDVEYPVDTPAPRGPAGADPVALAPFGIGTVDLDRLGAALRGEFGGSGPVFAEFQHRLILKAMNLDPRPLTTGFRWADPDDLPGAIRVKAVAQAPTAPHGTDLATIDVVVNAPLPRDVDPIEAGQLIADAVVDLGWPVRAEVGCVEVLPGAAAGIEIMTSTIRMGPAPRVETYFVRLQVPARPGRPSDDSVIAKAEKAWASALRRRYGLSRRQRPQTLRIKPEQFEIGFRAAVRYVSSRPAR